MAIRAHWSILVVAAIAGGFELRPGVWAGYAAVLLAHVLGRVALVRWFRFRVRGVHLRASGGRVLHAPDPELRGPVVWGGLVAQGLLLGLAAPLLPGIDPGHLRDFAWAAVVVNALLLVVNALPLPGSDGDAAWSFVRGLPAVRVRGSSAAPPDPSVPAPESPRNRLQREVATLEARVEVEKFLLELQSEAKRKRRD